MVLAVRQTVTPFALLEVTLADIIAGRVRIFPKDPESDAPVELSYRVKDSHGLASAGWQNLVLRFDNGADSSDNSGCRPEGAGD